MRWIYRLALKLRKLQLAHQHQPKICVHLEQEFVCGTMKQTAPPLNRTTLPVINICTDSRIKFREHIAKKATGYSFIYAVETGGERRAVGPTCSLSLRVRINVHDSKTVNIAYLEKSLQVQLYLEFGITWFYRVVFRSAVLAERPEIWIHKVSKYGIGEFGVDIISLIN